MKKLVKNKCKKMVHIFQKRNLNAIIFKSRTEADSYIKSMDKK